MRSSTTARSATYLLRTAATARKFWPASPRRASTSIRSLPGCSRKVPRPSLSPGTILWPASIRRAPQSARRADAELVKASVRLESRRKEPMSLSALRQRSAWGALERHYQKMADRHLRQLFAEDRERGERFTVEAADVY